MPCLNEARTLGACIRKAQDFLAEQAFAGEIVVADNGSTDGSRDIAASLGARVVAVPVRGYGSAFWPGSKPRAANSSSWAIPTTAMISARLDGFVARLARRLRSRHRQPFSRRHRARRHAAAAPLYRQSAPDLARPHDFRRAGQRFLLRTARLSPGRDPPICGLIRPEWSSRAKWWSKRRFMGCASPRCRPRCRPTDAAARRISGAGATAGALALSICC